MAEVVLVERKAALRETVRRLLVDAGHTVFCESHGMGALTVLVQHPRPLVALVGETADRDYDADVLISLLDAGFIPSSHAFILLTSDPPRTMPTQLAVLCAAHHIVSVRTPVEVGALLRAVASAADRLPSEVAPADVSWPSAVVL